jgi:hypothetical protein
MTTDLQARAKARDIDRLVDEAVQHPERAERVKASLKQKMLGAEREVVRSKSAAQASSYDLWDNVPV